MATANELFAANGEDYIVIDSDLRTMTFPASVNNIGVENDKDVHKLNFKMPRYFSGYDLSEFIIHINYVNANGDADMYYVLDPTIEENEIKFSWLVGRHACLYRGSVTFIVCLKLADGEGDVAQEFNTTLASLQVLPGLETEPTILETEHDIIEQLLLSINDTNAKIKAVLDTGLTPEQIAEFYNRSKNYGTEITSINNNLGYGGFGVNLAKSYKLIEHNATLADFTNPGWYRLGPNDFDDTMKSATDGTTFPMTQKDYYVQAIGTDFNNGIRYGILNVYTPRHEFFAMGRIWSSAVYHWEKAPLRSEFDALNSNLKRTYTYTVNTEDEFISSLLNDLRTLSAGNYVVTAVRQSFYVCTVCASVQSSNRCVSLIIPQAGNIKYIISATYNSGTIDTKKFYDNTIIDSLDSKIDTGGSIAFTLTNANPTAPIDAYLNSMGAYEGRWIEIQIDDNIVINGISVPPGRRLASIFRHSNANYAVVYMYGWVGYQVMAVRSNGTWAWKNIVTNIEIDDLNSRLTQRTSGIVTSRGVDMNQHKTYKITMASGEAYPIFFMYGQSTGSAPFAMVISAGNMFSETPTINYNAFVGSDIFSGVTASNGVITVEFTKYWTQFTIISKHKFTDEIV